jgi:hypothetical protein
MRGHPLSGVKINDGSPGYQLFPDSGGNAELYSEDRPAFRTTKSSQLELMWLAKIFVGICASPAFLANKLCILNQLFIVVKAAFDIAHIYQIA